MIFCNLTRCGINPFDYFEDVNDDDKINDADVTAISKYAIDNK